MAFDAAYASAVMNGLGRNALTPEEQVAAAPSPEQAAMDQAKRAAEDKAAAEKALAAIPPQNAAPTYKPGGASWGDIGAPPAPAPGMSKWGDIANDPLAAVAADAPKPTAPANTNATPAPANDNAGPGFAVIPGRVTGSPGGEVPTVGPHAQKLLELADEAQSYAATEVAKERDSRFFKNYLQAQVDEESAQAQMAGAEAKREEFLGKVDALQNEIKGEVARLATIKEDPDRLWNSKSDAQKVGAFIAIGLGGFLRSHNGGRNVALDQINHEVERDIQAQRTNYERQANSVRARQSEFGQLVQRYGMTGAEQIYGAAQTRAIMARAAKMAAQNGISETAVQYQSFIGDLDAAAARREAAGLKLVAPSLTQQAPVYFDERIGHGKVPLTAKQVFDLDSKLVEEGAKAGSKQQDTIGQETRFIAEKMGTKDLPEVRAAIDSAMADMPDGKDVNGIGIAASRVYEKSPALYESLYGADAARREQKWQTVRNKVINQLSGGSVSDSELARMQKQLDGANDAAARRTALEEAKRVLNSAEANIYAGVSKEAEGKYRKRRGELTAPVIREQEVK